MNRLFAEAHPTDQVFARLHRAGWSIGEVGQSDHWVVTGTNGENVIRASASSQSQAWLIALQQAECVGMLADETV